MMTPTQWSCTLTTKMSRCGSYMNLQDLIKLAPKVFGTSFDEGKFPFKINKDVYTEQEIDDIMKLIKTAYSSE